MASPDLRSLIEAARTAPVSADVPARVVPLIDLTSLKGGEDPAEIEALCARAVEHGTAAVCIYAEAVPIARPLLAGSSVRVATVANFPHGGDDIGVARGGGSEPGCGILGRPQAAQEQRRGQGGAQGPEAVLQATFHGGIRWVSGVVCNYNTKTGPVKPGGPN